MINRIVSQILSLEVPIYQESYKKKIIKDIYAMHKDNNDIANEIFDKLLDIIEEKKKEYGKSCMESRSSALDEFVSWLFEYLKG